MDQTTQSIIQQAEKFYNAKLIKENTLGNSANSIFEMITDKPVILRASEYSEKKKEHIDFELKWMAYLSTEMNNIVQPILSINKNLYEIVVCAKKYILCVFEEAKGQIVNVNDPREYNESLFFELGSIMGRMHNMTKKYNAYDDGAVDQFAWYNSLSFWPEYNIVIDDKVHSYEKKYIHDLHLLPKSKDTYGIIHADIQWANFFVDNGHITIFDFDDCEFNWYAKDIAITLFQFVQQSGISHKNKKERIEFAEMFLLSYLKGYVQANSISKFWILQLDMFMRYRRTTTYKFIQNIFKNEPINLHEEYMNWLRSEILLNTPFVEIDYRKIVNNIPSIRD